MNNLRLLLGILFAMLFACENNRHEATQTDAVAPTVAQERKAPPVLRAAPSRLEEDIALKADATTEKHIAVIRENYATITSKKDLEVLRKEILEYECENDPGGGTLTRYYDEDELVILHLSTGSEHSWESDMIYFAEGEPFFVFREEGYWQFGGPLNDEAPNTIDKIMEERLYLKDGKILKALDKSYEIRSWEEAVKTEAVPNRAVPELVGEEYWKIGELEKLKEGEVGC